MGADAHTERTRVPDDIPPCSAAERKFLEAIKAAAEDTRPLLPLPNPPMPPRPSGRSRTSRGRYRRAVAVWKKAVELTAVLNAAWGGPTSGSGGGNLCRELEGDCPVPRLPHARGPPAVLRAWGLLLRLARDMKSARRLVASELKTGEDLWSRLRKAACDAYGRAETSMPYVPF